MRNRAWQLPVFLLGVTLLGACNLINSFQGSDDKAIVAEIQSKLFQDPNLKLRNIQVISQKGVVVLTGTVSTDSEKAAAERMAGEAKSVKQVIDQISISSAPGTTSSAPEATSNAAINPPPAPLPARARSPRAVRRLAPESRATESDSYPSAAPSQAEPSAQAQARPVVAATAPPAPPEPERITIPAGTAVSVRMIDAIDSSRNRPGEEFAASLAAPVVVDDRVVIRQGSDARVRLVEAKSAGHMTGRSELDIELVQLTVSGTPYSVQSGGYQQVGASRGKRTAETVGGGAALGALIGAIAGKGKGAAIGAGVGAAAGTGVQAVTRGEQVKIPPETKIDFTLRSALTVTL